VSDLVFSPGDDWTVTIGVSAAVRGDLATGGRHSGLLDETVKAAAVDAGVVLGALVSAEWFPFTPGGSGQWVACLDSQAVRWDYVATYRTIKVDRTWQS